MVAILRQELDLEEMKTKAVIEESCAVIGCASTGSLIEQAERCLEALGVSEEVKVVTPESVEEGVSPQFASNEAKSAEKKKKKKRRRKKSSSELLLPLTSQQSEVSSIASSTRTRLCKRGVTVSNRKMCCSVYLDEDGSCEVEALDIDSTEQLCVTLSKETLRCTGIAEITPGADAALTWRFCSRILRRVQLRGDRALSFDASWRDETTDDPFPSDVDSSLRDCAQAFQCDAFWRDLASPLEFARTEMAKASSAWIARDPAAYDASRVRATDATAAVCNQLHALNASGTIFFEREHDLLEAAVRALRRAPSMTMIAHETGLDVR